MRKKVIGYTIAVALAAVLLTTGAYARASRDSEGAESYERLVEKNLELKGKNDELTDACEKLKGMHNVLLKKTKTLQDEKEILLSNQELLRLKLAEKEEELKEAPGDKGVFAGNKTRRKAEKKINRLEKEIATMEKRRKDAEVKYAMGLAEAKRTRDEAVAKGEKKLAAMSERLIEALSETEGSRETSGAKIAELEEKLTARNAKIAKLEEKFTAMDEGRRAAEAKYTMGVTEVKRMRDAKITKLEKKLAGTDEQLKRALSETEGSREMSGAEIAKLEGELAARDEGMVKAEAGYAEDLAEIENTVSKEISMLDKQLKDARSDREKLGQKLESADSDKKKLEDKLKKTLAEKDKSHKAMKEEIKLLKKEFKDANSDGKKLEKERAKYETRCVKQEKQIAELNQEINMQDGRINALKKEKKKLASEANQAVHAKKAAERKSKAEQERVKKIEQGLNKERLDMHYNLAVVFDRNGMYEDAEREYQKCLSMDPNDAGVYHNLGILYDDKLHNNSQARKYYMKFLKLRAKGDQSRLVRKWLFRLEEETRIGVSTR